MTGTPLKTLLCAATIALMAAAFRPATGLAAEAQLIGEFNAWKAASFQEDGGKGCFMLSAPEKSEGKYTRRDPTYVHVTHRSAAGTRDVVSVTAGYTYRSGSDVKVTIGNDTFTLFTRGGAAWADDATDRRLVEAMRKGSRMIVQGTSSRGTLTTDTYSLSGFSRAHDAINEACPAE